MLTQLPPCLRNIGYSFLKRFAPKVSLTNNSKFSPAMSIYEIPLIDIQGRSVTLQGFKGKRMLIVNTASECGYTPQYATLEELHRKYNEKIVVLGFPCNDFGAQEPGSDTSIKDFCQVNYGVSFPLFSKVHIKGSDRHPLYKWLTDPALNGWNSQEPTWNFCKYLVNENGELLHFFNAASDPLDPLITT